MAQKGSNERFDLPLAVIVGAGGMGAAICRRLGQSHRLLIADRDGEHVTRFCAHLQEEGYDARGLACDVTELADVERLAARAGDAGPVRTLVNVVGLSVAAGDARTILKVNITGAATVAAAFRYVLTEGACGIFISSSSAHMTPVSEATLQILDDPLGPDFIPNLETAIGPNSIDAGSAYMLSKVALNRMCVRLASDWGKRNLRILSLSPGLIGTPMGAEAYKHSPAKQQLFEVIALQREGTMLEIAGVVEFLASDQASYISGTDILVDGGLIASLQNREGGASPP